MNTSRIPSPAIILAFVLGLFFVIAGFGSWIPGLVKDRYHEQFLPMFAYIFGEESALVPLLAGLSQVVIGFVELLGGLLFLWGTFDRRNRLFALKAAYGLMLLLMGTFMVVLFWLHLYELPRWAQFPAILAMLLLGWVVTEREERMRASG